MVTLFKSDKTGKLRFCTVHDLQRSLLGGWTLTVIHSVGEKSGDEVMRVFDREFDRALWLKRLIARKTKAGYRELYSYGIAESSKFSRSARRVG